MLIFAAAQKEMFVLVTLFHAVTMNGASKPVKVHKRTVSGRTIPLSEEHLKLKSVWLVN